MTQEIPFEPFPFLDDPHQQTVISAFFNILTEPSSMQQIITLPDEDKISLEITTPEGWKETDRTVLLIHGLCGSHQSPNLVRMAKRLTPLNVRAIRFNMRGCGSGRGLARKIFHGGRSEDVFEALKWIKMTTPSSPTVVVGFSLGGNLALKLAGEMGPLAHRFMERVIAVSPPVDLLSSIRMIGESENKIYERYFYRLLRANVHYLQKTFKDLPRVQLPRNLKLYEFDQLYTAPMCGFAHADDYYQKCSAATYIDQIDIPCKILLAEDDPIVAAESIDQLLLPPSVEVFKTKKGGHMGYLGNPNSEKGLYWLDSLLVDWIS
ncbi:MAG: hypothetical protein RL235_1079 [Chlamydiota bacterium]